MDNSNNDLVGNSIGSDHTLEMTRVIFHLLWSRNERMLQLLEAHAPRRLEQERIFRTKGKNCRYYTALCKTIVAEIIEGKLPPEFSELINEEIQYAGCAI